MTSFPAGNGGVTFPSPNEWPITRGTVTGISNGLQATITVVSHGFTNALDQNITQIDFSQVKGMSQINGQFGYITNVVDANNFQVGINTSNYSTYTSGGFANINAGNAPYDPFTNLYS
jgi:hypothetical protein